MNVAFPRITDTQVMLRNCALDLFVGNSIGEGSSRCVYELEREPDKVLKIEYAGKTFHNIIEWKIWEAVAGTQVCDWFAACYEIDCWGSALIQQRADVFQSEREFTRALNRTRAGHIPAIFDDVRYNNFGLIDDVVACVDYGYSHLFDRVRKELMIEEGWIKIDPAQFEYKPECQLALDL